MLLLLLAGQGDVCAQGNGMGLGEGASLSASRDSRPQWRDVGMEDVLVVGQSSISVPTSVRHHTLGNASLERRSVEVQRHFRTVPHASSLPHRALPGYLYFLLCLRL